LLLLEPTDNKHSIHPSLLDNVDTKGYLKWLKFRLWSAHMSRNETSLEEVIKNELKLYEDRFPARTDYKVRKLL
jgi:hypothetical protein